MYKSSFYNITLPNTDDGDSICIWNAASEAIIKLEKPIYNCILNQQFDSSLLTPIMDNLLEQGIVVHMEEDEFYKIAFEGRIKQYQPRKSFLMVIAPTLMCNYKCVYCFENGVEVPPPMTEETMIAILHYAENYIKNNKQIDTFMLQWFGGEPLILYDKIIAPFSLKMKDICEKYNIKFESSITTNGYFLTETIIVELIDEFNTNKFQVTFDGTVDNYCRRKNATAQAYEKVKDNLFTLAKYAYGHNTKTKIHVRINVDRNNIDDAHEFVREIKSDSRYLPNIYFYLGRLRFNKEMNGSFFSVQDYEKAVRCFDNEFNIVRPVRETKRVWCSQFTINSICIGPRGELYKCEHFFGQKDRIIGNVRTGLCYNKNYYDYMNMPISDRCRDCKIFPVCLGGCPADRSMRAGESCEFTLAHCIYLAEQYIKNNYIPKH